MTTRDYFEALAAEHSLIRHCEAEPHFAASMDDAGSLMARRLNYPAVFLDEGDMRVTGTTGNELLQHEYAIAFANHVADSGNKREKQQAFDLTEQLLTDFLGRMVRDKGIGEKPVARFNPIGCEAHRVELSEAGLYGWILLFTLETRLSALNCNQHFKS